MTPEMRAAAERMRSAIADVAEAKLALAEAKVTLGHAVKHYQATLRAATPPSMFHIPQI